jgi:hypothetical protein
MATTLRVLAPSDVTRAAVDTGYGRSYNGAPGTVLDVPLGDGLVLIANGWTYANLESGPSSERPAHLTQALSEKTGRYGRYFDTDLGKLIVWDGANWRDPANGNVV